MIDKLVLSVAMACVMLGFVFAVYAVGYFLHSYPVAGLVFAALVVFCYYFIQVFEL